MNDKATIYLADYLTKSLTKLLTGSRYLFAIFFIAIQAYITVAIAQNSDNLANQTRASDQNINFSTELAKIKEEKQAIEAKAKVQEAACYKKFAVNDCLKDSKVDKTVALNSLKKRELELNDKQRAIKAQAVEDKAVSKKDKSSVNNELGSPNNDNAASKNKKAAALKSDSEEKAPTTTKAAREAKPRAEKLPPSDQQRLAAAQNRVNEANKKAIEAQKKAVLRAGKTARSGEEQAKFDKKIQAAQAHKLALEQRKASSTKPKAATLPIPTAAELAPKN